MVKHILIFSLLCSICFGARVGYITDVHWTDMADRTFQHEQSGPRFYSESANEITAFCTAMALHDPDAVVEGGDFVEDSDDGDPQTDLDTIEDLFDAFSPRYHVIGNWDLYDPCWADAADYFDQIENGNDPCVLTLPTTDGEAYFAAGSESGANISRYYAFEMPDGVIGIVLDSTGQVTGDTTKYYIHSQGLLGQGGIPTAQMTWLDTFLDNNTTVPIIVFVHHHVWPWQIGYAGDGDAAFRIVRNAETLKTTLEQHGNVVAVFSGHAHPASQQYWSDTLYDQYIDGPEINSNLSHFYTKSNGIRYYPMRATVTGWGAGSTSTSDSDVEEDFESWGETTPASAYYLITAGANLGDNGQYYVHVKGYGANPGGLSDDDNMLARWKLDDTAGQKTVESTNGNQDGTSANNIIRGSGAPPALNSSMAFAVSSTDYITNDEIVVSQYPFTFAGWFKIPAGGVTMTIFAVNDASASQKFAAMRINSSNQAEMGVRNGVAAEETTASSITYVDNTWHHMVAVFTDSTHRDLYVDGTLVAIESAGEKTMPSNITNWSIGARKYTAATTDYLTGSLADIQVYDVALTAAEIREIYKNGAIVNRRYLSGRQRKRF